MTKEQLMKIEDTLRQTADTLKALEYFFNHIHWLQERLNDEARKLESIISHNIRQIAGEEG